jgi:hypothetical protein
MKTFILIMYISTGLGQFSTGGPLVVDNISTKDKCETIAEEFKNSLKGVKAVIKGKYDWHICKEVTK